MALHQQPDGCFVISSSGVWLPGAYEDSRAARFAFRLPDESLQRLQDEANIRAGGVGGVITWSDVAKELERIRKRPNTDTETRQAAQKDTP